ncbi:unnamed protein product [Durusdinium trenchii]|uniref:Calcium-dependent protein kinase n=2 Tax=Durusdinium trenchii TaxID=1381693 RepID=A0ABP0I277_9DINO
MLLLPKAAVERNAPRADGGRWSLLGYFGSEQLDQLGRTSGQRESLIKEGARGGDFLLFHHSGSSFASTYSVVHKIGEGGFGKVFAATHRTTGIMRAVKRLRKVPGRQELHKNELNALLGLDHPHIVKLLEYYDEEEYLYLVFELCEGLDLLETIRRSKAGRLGQLEASVVLRHMLKALQCCHAQYRGHYDIKPENFMFKRETNGDIAHANLKMVDLGLSSCFDMHRENRISGTTAYMAPEFWSGIYGPEGDVWSCGVVLFVMLTGTPLLDDISPATVKREILVRHLLRDRITSAAEEYNLSASALDLLMQMLQHDRHARPTIKEALKHRFNHDVYELEKAMPCPERLQAMELLRQLPELVRVVRKEPMLKRVARLAMVHVSEVEEATCLAFRMLDTHGYGELSISALEENDTICRQTVPDLDALFEAMDLNRDGYISYRAFLAVTLPEDVRCNASNLQVTFNVLDADKDGLIGQADLAEVFGHVPDSEVCSLTIREVSKEETISWDAFVALVAPELVVAKALLHHCLHLDPADP